MDVNEGRSPVRHWSVLLATTGQFRDRLRAGCHGRRQSVIDPFEVGSDVTWELMSPQGYEEYLLPYIGETEVARITHTADLYGYPREFRATGTVIGIKKLYGEQTLWPGSDVGGYAVAGSGRFIRGSEAIRWEEEKEGLAFIGYIVDLEVSSIRSLSGS